MSDQRAEKRSCPRFPWSRSIQVIPLDDDWKQAGPAIQAQAKDLSQGGISFRQTDFMVDSHAAVMLKSNERMLLMLLQILRCREVQGEYEIAGRFVAKLSDVEHGADYSLADASGVL